MSFGSGKEPIYILTVKTASSVCVCRHPIFYTAFINTHDSYDKSDITFIRTLGVSDVLFLKNQGET